MKPFTTPLGQAMHLNGTVPRGRDLTAAVPRRCQRCSALFIVFGKGSAARAKYCQDCRATKCPSCNNAGGGHYPYCGLVQPRPCKGCGVERPRKSDRNTSYCERCRAQRCPACKHYAGQHQAACLYTQRRRPRPRLTEYRGVVTEEDILHLYLANRVKAIRIARKICGAEGEDVVQDTVLYLLEKRDYLTAAPGKAYFFRAVTHTAIRRHLYAWAKYVVAMDPEDLVLAEQAMYPGENGAWT